MTQQEKLLMLVAAITAHGRLDANPKDIIAEAKALLFEVEGQPAASDSDSQLIEELLQRADFLLGQLNEERKAREESEKRLGFSVQVERQLHDQTQSMACAFAWDTGMQMAEMLRATQEKVNAAQVCACEKLTRKALQDLDEERRNNAKNIYLWQQKYESERVAHEKCKKEIQKFDQRMLRVLADHAADRKRIADGNLNDYGVKDLIAAQNERDAAQKALADLRDDCRRAAKIGYQLTLDNQTMAEMADSLVDLVKKARAERDEEELKKMKERELHSRVVLGYDCGIGGNCLVCLRCETQKDIAALAVELEKARQETKDVMDGYPQVSCGFAWDVGRQLAELEDFRQKYESTPCTDCGYKADCGQGHGPVGRGGYCYDCNGGFRRRGK